MKLVSFICIFIFSSTGLCEELDVNYLELAKILVKDGRYLRAEKTLKKVDTNDLSDQALYSSLLGMVNLHKKQYEKSILLFEQSLQQGLKEKEIYLYMAEAFLQLKKIQKAEKSLDKTSVDSRNKLPYILLKAEILWQQKLKTKAWALLVRAEGLNLPLGVINKKKFQYLLAEGLYQAAGDIALSMVSELERFEDVLAMASQLRLKKENQRALNLLQTLLIQKPGDERVALEMAQNYLVLKENFSAALVLEKAAKYNDSLSYEAAEMLRQGGKSYRARFLNLSTLDPSLRLKQKLALYLEDDDYFSLSFMIPQLHKEKLLEDQDIRYAVAYSLFRIGSFEKSENYLRDIDKSDLFEKSIELRKEIVNCQLEKWACSEVL